MGRPDKTAASAWRQAENGGRPNVQHPQSASCWLLQGAHGWTPLSKASRRPATADGRTIAAPRPVDVSPRRPRAVCCARRALPLGVASHRATHGTWPAPRRLTRRFLLLSTPLRSSRKLNSFRLRYAPRRKNRRDRRFPRPAHHRALLRTAPRVARLCCGPVMGWPPDIRPASGRPG